MTTTHQRSAKESSLHRATREFRELARQHRQIFGDDAKSSLRDRITILIAALNTGDYQQAVDTFQTIRDIVVGRIVSEDTERWLDNVRDELLGEPDSRPTTLNDLLDQRWFIALARASSDPISPGFFALPLDTICGRDCATLLTNANALLALPLESDVSDAIRRNVATQLLVYYFG